MIQLDRVPLPKAKSTELAISEDANNGLLIAILILTVWASSLVFLVSLTVDKLPFYWVIPAMIWQTFLYTDYLLQLMMPCIEWYVRTT
jgi:beta-carotene ketolase (CrtW type)